MKKPKLLYASPFPPKQSGISDYSVVLVKALQSRFDITLFTDDYEISDQSINKFPVVRYGKDEIDYDNFDYLIYNMGNNPEYHQYIYEAALAHPGMVIMHDMVIYYLFVGYYQQRGLLYSSTYSKLGLDDFLTIKEAVKKDGSALLEQKHMAAKLTMNRELVCSGNKIMVHSEYARNKILDTGWIDKSNIRHINLINQIEDVNDTKGIVDREVLFKKYGVPTDAIIISSFGYIANTKLNYEVCCAVKAIRDKVKNKICYVMVGDGNYIDSELEPGFIIKTGFTELDEFNSFVRYSDIIANLRNPSMGETSAAMIRILQLGKPCITNNGGWFTELPEDCVCKIELDNVINNIEVQLLALIENPEYRAKLGERAKKYIEDEYNGEVITQQIYDFLVDTQE